MGTKTTRLDLTKPGENDYYNQQTEQADNWQKVDDYAVYTDRDKNAIWGGLDGGGLIEDPSVTKVVGKRYIGADGKAYICLVPSNINNSTNYTPCNVVDNLDKLKNLTKQSEVLLSYAFHPPGTKITIPTDMRYISIYYARSGAGEANSDFTTIPISALKLMGHGIRKNMYNSATGSYSLVDIAISTSLVMTIINSNYGIMVVGHY